MCTFPPNKNVSNVQNNYGSPRGSSSTSTGPLGGGGPGIFEGEPATVKNLCRRYVQISVVDIQPTLVFFYPRCPITQKKFRLGAKPLTGGVAPCPIWNYPWVTGRSA